MKKPKRKTWAEYKREARKRERERKRDQPDALQSYLRHPFFEFYEEHADKSEAEIPFWLANLVPPSFDDDNPAVFPDILDGLDLPEANNSAQRAELIVACLIDAATYLAALIKDYKKEEILKRIDEIDTSGAADESAAKNASEIARLKKMLNQLNRQVRWSFPQWKVAGE